jgi:hypothetical protein
MTGTDHGYHGIMPFFAEAVAPSPLQKLVAQRYRTKIWPLRGGLNCSITTLVSSNPGDG